MKVTFLGTGTSQGVPVIACPCEVCSSADSRDNRLRCSILLEYGDKTVVVDTGPDFRQQMLRYGVKNLDAVIYTHEHKDHLAGLDDVRAFNYFQRKYMDLYVSSYVEEALRREFAYVFAEEKYPGIPLIRLHRITNSVFNVFGKEFLPVEVMHYKLPVFGYRTGDFCYITDAKSINDEELDKMRGAKVIVLNALRRETHISHFTLDEAVEILSDLKPEKAYLTHLSHQMGLHSEVEKQLPDFIRIAYDGLVLHV
jgi:phosphoribosyl 1,2-cyclic phosphate phosphodiesterase